MIVTSTRTVCAKNEQLVGLRRTHIQQPSALPASTQAARALHPGALSCPWNLRAPTTAAALWDQPQAGAGGKEQHLDPAAESWGSLTKPPLQRCGGECENHNVDKALCRQTGSWLGHCFKKPLFLIIPVGMRHLGDFL